MPKVTVLMPVYNGEKYLRKAIESILNQTFKDFEFLIINDGSTDRTKEIILSYRDQRIVYLENEENIGLTKSLNKGLKIAKGEYIARMDGDDVSLPERLEKQVEFLDRNSDYVLVGSDCTVLDESGKKIRTDLSILSNSTLKAALALKNCFKHGSVMFRKDTFFSAEGYDENFYCTQDYDLWTRMVKKGSVCNLPEVLFYRREHSKSIGSLNSYKQTENADIIRKKYWDSFGFWGPAPLFSWRKVWPKEYKNRSMEGKRLEELARLHSKFGTEYYLRKKHISAHLHFLAADNFFKIGRMEIFLTHIYMLVSPEKFNKFLNNRCVKFLRKFFKEV